MLLSVDVWKFILHLVGKPLTQVRHEWKADSAIAKRTPECLSLETRNIPQNVDPWRGWITVLNAVSFMRA
jgi:hypothetical protein